MQYLVTMTTHVPDGTLPERVEDVGTREARHARELADWQRQRGYENAGGAMS
jgi:muconolactone D-isomerase